MIYIVAITAAVIGSYLNVFIIRYNSKESSFYGRSHCMSCNHTIAWYHMIPIISYVILKGKCQYCGAQISKQYPIVEGIHMVMWILIFIYCQAPIKLPLYMICSLLLVISMIDMRTFEIPNECNLLYFFCVLCYLFTQHITMDHIVGFFSVSSVFYLLYILSHKLAIGGGDIKLMATSGLLLGIYGVWIALLIACLCALGIEVFIKKTKGIFPFAPYLCFSTYCVLLYFM